jgi:PIN domain nuclease of toxin-antitoxin system
MLVEKHRLSLKIDFEKWLEMNELMPCLNFVPVNNKIAFQSTRLLGDFHADPADRIIVATAIVNDWKLITKDKKNLDYNYVESIW